MASPRDADRRRGRPATAARAENLGDGRADSSMRWAFGALTENAIDHAGPVDVDDFQTLRRQGLFDDDGRNPPPSWWAR